MNNDDRRSGTDRRKCQRRTYEQESCYIELSKEIDCANKEIKRLSDEIRDIQISAMNNKFCEISKYTEDF